MERQIENNQYTFHVPCLCVLILITISYVLNLTCAASPSAPAAVPGPLGHSVNSDWAGERIDGGICHGSGPNRWKQTKQT